MPRNTVIVDGQPAIPPQHRRDGSSGAGISISAEGTAAGGSAVSVQGSIGSGHGQQAEDLQPVKAAAAEKAARAGPLKATVIGAGIAGSEAAWQLAQAGVDVEVLEMRPLVMTKAHRTGLCAELVCSNSFRGADLSNAVGLLKEELKRWQTLFMEAAIEAEVAAGGALAVDREVFSRFIDTRIRSHLRIKIIAKEGLDIPQASREQPVIIAAGPLAGASLARSIAELTGEGSLAFYDAISPIILDQSIDHQQCFLQSRYDKGPGNDYLNLPLSKEQYYRFVEEIVQAEKHSGHEGTEGEDAIRPFEGCMPIEDMAVRGPDTLLFGPLKPVGLSDPRTGKRPYAVVQLRHDDKAGTLWNMVGMQTRMKHGEQLRIFRRLPGLEQAEFVRLGTVHRNTFINSPQCLNSTLEFRRIPGLFFAGQITGTEGYVEAAAGGLAAGINAARVMRGQEPAVFSAKTAVGALLAYISDPARKDFQPMNISYGLMPSYLSMEKTRTGRQKAGKKRTPASSGRTGTGDYSAVLRIQERSRIAGLRSGFPPMFSVAADGENWGIFSPSSSVGHSFLKTLAPSSIMKRGSGSVPLPSVRSKKERSTTPLVAAG